MNALLNNVADSVSLRDVALSFTDTQVGDKCIEIIESFERRDTFEAANGLSLTADSSYVRERKAICEKSLVAVARLFLALDLNASDVIERKVNENAMFNAKALKKIREIAQFTCGFGESLEKVMRAFIACAIVATDKGHAVLTNAVNVRFLNSSDLAHAVTDQDTLDAIASLKSDVARHGAMTSGAATQSSQARNVLDVLGLGKIQSVTKPRDAIAIDSQHAFFALFRSRFMS